MATAVHTTSLLSELRERGVALREEGGRLCFEAPPGTLTPELRNELVRRKAELLAALRGAGTPAGEGAAAASLERLFEPVAVGGLRLANRLVLSPMEVDLAGPGGEITDRVLAYYAARAAGGVGLVVVEATCVDGPVGLVSPVQLRADRDADLPGLERLARTVRRQGVPAVLQLQHAGRKTSALVTGERPVAPSPVANHRGETPRELAPAEIEGLVAAYPEAAARAQLAGFDGVEIHAAHGYLLAQFLSPFYNRRSDGWGGDLAGRARFLLAVVAAVRARVGAGYPVLCRLSAADLEAPGEEIRPLPGGLTRDEAVRVAVWLEQAGVAAVDVSATLVGPAGVHPMDWPEGYLAPLARAVKEAVAVPVGTTARLAPELAARLVAEGGLDLVRLGRPLLADPELPRKLRDGTGDVVSCIFCGVCTDPARRRPEVVCTVNPRLGREGEDDLAPAPVARRVVVVGGGAAGLTAAACAAARGHRVTLLERHAEPGGLLCLPGETPGASASLERLRAQLVRRAERSGVELRTAQAADAAAVRQLGADVVVLATGARPTRPAVPIAEGAPLLFAVDVLRGAATGERVVVVGSERLGCQAALHLAAAGRRVTLLGRHAPARRVVGDLRPYLLGALERRGVELLHPVRVEEIGPEGVTVTAAGGRRLLPADSVVLAAGAEPSNELADDLAGDPAGELAGALAGVPAGAGPQVVTVGDARSPRGLAEAIEDGYRTGCAV